jgi:hypothetical protein
VLFLKYAWIAAFLTAGLAWAGTITRSNPTPDTRDLSSSMDASGDHRTIISGDSQPEPSNQDITQGPRPNLLDSVQTDAVPPVPEPSTLILIGGAACVALVGHRKLARR